MRGQDTQQAGRVSHVSPDARVPATPLQRPIRQSVDRALTALSAQAAARYARIDRPSIAPEQLLRTLGLQVLSDVRSEQLLMEQSDSNLRSRWFVGLDPDATGRNRLLAGQLRVSLRTL